jgi:4-azaleucine resistance transporter AzlC
MPPTASTGVASLRRGARHGLTVLLGYVPIGAAFGIVATTAAGLTPLQAVACSALVFAGSGQFIAARMLAAGAGALPILVATAVVNLRHILFAATIAPHVRDVRSPTLLGIGFTLTDEVFAVDATDTHEGRANGASMIATGFTAWSGWLAGTALGAFGATLIGDPSRWGVDFAMPAMFTALLVGQLTGRRFAVAGVAAALMALAFSTAMPREWAVIAASMVAATMATAVER